MAYLELDSSWASTTHRSFEDSFDVYLEGSIPANLLALPEASTSSLCHNRNIPEPPPLPGVAHASTNFSKKFFGYSYVLKETKDTWDTLFKEGYKADVHILTADKTIIPAHSSVLGISSPLLRNFLDHAKVKGGIRCIRIPGVPSGAVHAFIRFLYSSCYEQEDMERFVYHLLVLSHAFSVPSLKKICVDLLQQELLTVENVIDVLQLARECDMPRLSLFCNRLVVKNFKSVSTSEGWKVMKKANPSLEQELLESVVEADSRKHEKLKKREERNIYLQLYDAMEALLHICRDGCGTIGPREKLLKGTQASCSFTACKGLELLVRHFSSCKRQVPGGCVHCKRMWQLLELHSCMCGEPDSCKVPLCRHFKEKMQQQSKKDEAKWRLLVSKVMAAKSSISSFTQWKNPFISDTHMQGHWRLAEAAGVSCCPK
ncbi:BTB/POZ and TAZ domain-containing protein 3 [Magnolia sinica]|uniref:BTB/POZ and TAZ domain-containing protein 3 n=1 Tax=Magnolia sinica TaxID=86752 RepID=UPI00265A9D04|nr:BTB/POZ and TAZ domain-containing protein 3 [Magnolia sinica]XP_058094333.1 BTB/POZ and TAZ domain-containing protein 3 [Magnolia sinica]XP_058094334.1 BTB/POZ and TAZ domain-containing protein 3 [Magnolia sinica]XP_058094335.1 BTB/POZ and TAZ domain-containing protein 3 [Magnolia sinica]XP_058094337.1 BTB/POZ and TAZ domain-containing protein 3 [Magnolia sinica]